MLPPIFKKFIQLLDSFPEIGPRQAWRLFFWLLRQDEKFLEQFLDVLKTIKERKKFCNLCYFPTINEEICEICNNQKRNKEIICIVARETDLITIESTKKYQGVYFVLGGLIIPYEDKVIIKERLNVLKKRLSEGIKEAIIALPFTREAEPTLKELERIFIQFPKIKVKKPKKGIPLGGEIEFLDPETLTSALEL